MKTLLRALAGALVLLASPTWAAQTWPEKEGRQFTPDSATQKIRLCRPGLGCTPGKTFPVQQNNCGWFSWPGTFPADNTYPGYCEPEPPVVTPPPVTPPPVTPPPITPPIYIPTLARLKFCGINLNAALKDIQVRLLPIGNPAYIGYPGVAVWLCPGSNWPQFQYYTKAQLADVTEAFANNRAFTTAQMQAWIDAQPVEPLNQIQDVYIASLRSAWTPHYEVTVDQPVYPLTASGNRSTVAVSGATVKRGEWCWSSVRPATSLSDWYSVKGRAVRANGTLVDTAAHYVAHCKFVNPFAQ